MSELPSLPGMSHNEWLFREGKALAEHGAETDNPKEVREGQEKSLKALEETAKSVEARIFADLFPGEDIPEDWWELKLRIDRSFLVRKNSKRYTEAILKAYKINKRRS